MKWLVKIILLFYSSVAFSQQRNAEVINYETNIIIRNGILNKNELIEIKINNRAGERFTKVTIPYSKLVKISNIEGQIKSKNGKIIRKLSKSEIKDRNAISDYSFYEDNYIKEFILKHNEYPYYIEYSYDVQQKEFLYIDYWIPVIDAKVPTIMAKLTIQTPNNYPIKFYNQFVDNIKIDSTSSEIKYTWNTFYLNFIKDENFSPSFVNLVPKVLIVPNEFKFDLPGSFKNWQTYGSWQYNLNLELNELPENEKIKINSIIKGTRDKRDLIRELYHYLQDNTRYINITIETGGLKPYPAKYVADNKYGDCKALTNYLKSILEYAGISSSYVKVQAGNPIIPIIKDFPSQQFNHVILCVPFENDTIWLDCTSDGPFNYLGTFTQNREVFVIEKDHSYFTNTPKLSIDDICEKRKIVLSKGVQEGEIIADFYNDLKGEKFESLSYIINAFNEVDQKQIILKSFGEKKFEIVNFKIEKPPRDSFNIKFSLKAKSDIIYEKYGDELILRPIPFEIFSCEDPKSRDLPVQIDYPIYKIDTIEYFIPKGFEIFRLFDSKSINSNFGSYFIELKPTNDKIMVIKKFVLNSGYYKIEEYNKFYDFIKNIKDIESNNNIVLIKK
ncbi:MAG: hypothetical protein A2W99_02495 [Bacteroidetes bacterium GWF2_33_16]|nr:MAG: hypothetical protein A2X00_15660 [Bacteroidetes bacterium GWE2_32_14]OFY07130.1 MAG: hypothetical protein A2W99_02495 [Bacteroidetes bacterium GWF2_33_16]